MEQGELKFASNDDDKAKDAELSRQEELQKEKEKILADILEARIDTLQQRVAWILNHYPEARDSDITCQLYFWKHFDGEIYNPMRLIPDDLYKLTRLTSIARSRAYVQNVHKLFLATPVVRQRRGKLEEDEKQKAFENRRAYPIYVVYADESGKNEKHIIVGSMWVNDAFEIRLLKNAINDWRERTNFKEELHFKEINRENIDRYIEAIAIIKEWSTLLCFKAISIKRSGIKDISKALSELYLNLLVRGVEHENDTGRAALPRTIQLWKDAEEPGSDSLMLKNIHTRLREISASIFENKLVVDEFYAINSKGDPLLQITDLFTSSVNRKLNSAPDGQSPKDIFATKFLSEFGLVNSSKGIEGIGDCLMYDSL
jgi:hypothetical protein